MKLALIPAGNLQDLISHLLGSAHRSPSLISWGLALDQMAANARPALPGGSIGVPGGTAGAAQVRRQKATGAIRVEFTLGPPM